MSADDDISNEGGPAYPAAHPNRSRALFDAANKARAAGAFDKAAADKLIEDVTRVDPDMRGAAVQMALTVGLSTAPTTPKPSPLDAARERLDAALADLDALDNEPGAYDDEEDDDEGDDSDE